MVCERWVRVSRSGRVEHVYASESSAEGGRSRSGARVEQCGSEEFVAEAEYEYGRRWSCDRRDCERFVGVEVSCRRCRSVVARYDVCDLEQLALERVTEA